MRGHDLSRIMRPDHAAGPLLERKRDPGWGAWEVQVRPCRGAQALHPLLSSQYQLAQAGTEACFGEAAHALEAELIESVVIKEPNNDQSQNDWV
jgi:hypothetical protein